MISEFRRHKLALGFRMNDLDGDGYVSAEDFDQVVANYAKAYAREAGDPEVEKLRELYAQQWEAIKGFDADGDGRVGLDEYLAGYEAFLADHDTVMANMDYLLQSFYAIVDRDGDGVISEDELALNWVAHGQTAEAARVAFAKLDRNGNGGISKDEMVQNMEEMMFSDDPEAPGNWVALSLEEGSDV